ncbi:MAG TPA: hypothetical protein VFT22_44405 [Kofleriaceae bacterium]|nr:hypothetical protein [Kofleriaceae bacterium]
MVRRLCTDGLAPASTRRGEPPLRMLATGQAGPPRTGAAGPTHTTAVRAHAPELASASRTPAEPAATGRPGCRAWWCAPGANHQRAPGPKSAYLVTKYVHGEDLRNAIRKLQQDRTIMPLVGPGAGARA